jgi:hypothetical protein
MKRLIALSALGLLLSGCKLSNNSREHVITCLNSTSGQLSYRVVTSGNVGAFVVQGHSVLSYRDEDGKVQIILLSKNDCIVY